jgi:hypothetical protein
MSKKGASRQDATINEAKPLANPAEPCEDAGCKDLFCKKWHKDWTPAEPKAAEPQPAAPTAPTLTADQKLHLLTLQRSAVVTENQKLRADQAFEKAMAELNRAYQSVNQHQGFSLNEFTLEFVNIQPQA